MSNPGSIPTPIHRSKRSSRSSRTDRKSTRLNSSHGYISYAVFCLKKKKNHRNGGVMHELATMSVLCVTPCVMRESSHLLDDGPLRSRRRPCVLIGDMAYISAPRVR